MSPMLAPGWPAAAPAAKRTREVARVLAHHGLESLLATAGLRAFTPPWHRGASAAPARTQAERLRLALGELGATFIKLGQTLSTRADLLPQEFIVELAKLQDAAPLVPFEAIERIVEEELGAPPSVRFAQFESKPLASASIGQVHAAVLHDGREVVVKVRRPGVAEQVELDLSILRAIAEWVQHHTAIGEDYAIEPVVDEFAHTLHNELDYVREAQNATRFRAAFQGDTRIVIPRVYEEYSTHRVLTLERIRGVRLSDRAGIDALGVPRRAVAENAVRSFLKEVLEFGFFHADPHPGNYFVQPDGALAIVDFGMTGRVNALTQQRLLRAGLAALQQDAEALAEELYSLGVAGRRADRAAFQKDLDHLLGFYGGFSLADLSARDVVSDLVRIVFRHRLQLPGELALLLRVVSMSEGVGLTLDPEFRYFEYASPIFRRDWQRRHSLRAGLVRTARAAGEAAELGVELPRRLERLLSRLERGETQLVVQHQGLERVTREFQRMTNRLALSVILAASVVAVGIAASVHGDGGDPLLGALLWCGMLFSLAFGLSVSWAIWRSGRR